MATSAPHVMLPEEEEKVQHLLFGSDWVNGEKWEETVCKLAGMMGHIATHTQPHEVYRAASTSWWE